MKTKARAVFKSDKFVDGRNISIEFNPAWLAITIDVIDGHPTAESMELLQDALNRDTYDGFVIDITNQSQLLVTRR